MVPRPALLGPAPRAGRSGPLSDTLVSLRQRPRPAPTRRARARPQTQPHMEPMRIVVGISGASGAQYATRLLETLLAGGHHVHLVATEYGRRLLHDELGVRTLDLADLVPGMADRAAELTNRRYFVHPHKDVGAVIASGSFLHDGMVVVPCSSAALGYIAGGSGSNLLCRAAMVTLKERRPLVLVHRESPLSLIDIRNMETVTLAGGIVAPANPGWYLRPRSLGDLIDFVVGKCLDLLRVPHELKVRWEDARGLPGDGAGA